MNQPDALLMCLRQNSAKITNIAFENLIAYISCKESSNKNVCYTLKNLTLEMFDYNDDKLVISETISKSKDLL